MIGSFAKDIHQLPVYAVLEPMIYYQVASIPQAVDVILKAGFVLDINYPVATRSTWTFVQRAIYGICTKDDVLSARTSVLLGELGSV